MKEFRDEVEVFYVDGNLNDVIFWVAGIVDSGFGDGFWC